MYAGDQDFICNFEGNTRWTDSMVWAGAAAYAKATPTEWLVDGVPAGSAKSAAGLTMLRVYGAGCAPSAPAANVCALTDSSPANASSFHSHMVPMDQPKAALDMLQRFMDGTAWA